MKNRLKKLSMQKKMVLAFAVPIIIIYIILNTVCYHFITVRYEEQLHYSMEQSSQQAVYFLENYVQNMQYLTGMIEGNGAIQEILSSDEFSAELPMDEEYREFWRLRDSFTGYDLSNPVYRLQLYVDDRKFYSSSHQYFFEESLVENRSDYAIMEEYLSRNETYLTVTEEDGASYVTLFKRIYAQDALKSPLNICSVSVEAERFEELVGNANVTGEGVAYLVDQNNQIVLVPNSEKISGIAEEELPLSGSEQDWEQTKLGGEAFFMIRKNIGDVGWQMISLIPLEEYHRQQMFIGIFQYIMIGSITVVVIVTSYILARYYVGRLSNLNQKMNVIQNGNLNVQLPVVQEKQGDEVDEIFSNFNFMVDELRRLMQEHFQLGKEVKISELKALQSQINPHFLYNTLDLINWMAMDYGAADIENIVWNLSRFYRLSLNKGKNILTVKEEVEHVQVYVNIENIHFDQAIHFTTEIPEEIEDKACLNIILQPLVENAIVHGIAEIPSIREMNIRVWAEVEDGDIIFHVQDDGPGMSREQVHQLETDYMNPSGKGYGVRNINFRIKLCFGEKYGITYDSEPGRGTTANIRIPLLEYEEAEKMIGN